MTRTISALAVALFASSLCAEERIHIYTSYKDSDETSVQRRLDCFDSKCKIEDGAAKRSINLSEAQRDELLAGFKIEAQRFNTKHTPRPGDWTLRVKVRYQTERGRLQITRDLPKGQFDDVAPELRALVKTYLGQDLSNPGSSEPPADEAKKPAPPRQ